MNLDTRLYSLDLAHRALALVRPIVEDLVRARILWEEAMEGLAFPAGGAWGDPMDAGVKALSRLYDRRMGYRRELEDLGVHLLDERQGEVGFPSRLGGRLVLLSWMLGDERIEGWRPLSFFHEEKGPWFPLSSSPECKARTEEGWDETPEFFPDPEEGDFPLL